MKMTEVILFNVTTAIFQTALNEPPACIMHTDLLQASLTIAEVTNTKNNQLFLQRTPNT